jgi:hypothetical protein
MECREIEEVMLDYVRGMLDQEETMRVKAHINNCADCRRELEELLPMVELLGEYQFDQIKAPKHHVQKIVQMAHELAPQKGRQQPSSWLSAVGKWFQELFSAPLVPSLVTACLVVIIVGTWFFWPPVKTPGNVVLQLVEGRIYFPSKPGVHSQGVAGISNQLLPVWAESQVTVKSLAALETAPNKVNVMIILDHIIKGIVKSGLTEQYPHAVQRIEKFKESISQNKDEQEDIIVRMEQDLVRFMKITDAKDLLVRLGIRQMPDGEIILAIGRPKLKP